MISLIYFFLLWDECSWEFVQSETINNTFRKTDISLYPPSIESFTFDQWSFKTYFNKEKKHNIAKTPQDLKCNVHCFVLIQWLTWNIIHQTYASKKYSCKVTFNLFCLCVRDFSKCLFQLFYYKCLIYKGGKSVYIYSSICLF